MTRPSVLGALALFLAGCSGEVASTPGAPGPGGGGAPLPGPGGSPPAPMPAPPGIGGTPTTESPDAAPAGTTLPPPGAGGAPVPPATPAGSDPGSDGDGDVMIGPGYTPAPELTARAGVPKGTIVTFVMKSTDSKFYPGLNGPFMRPVAVYVPHQYVPGTAAPFIVSADGSQWTGRFSAILDNMIADKKLPVMIAININNGGGDSKGSERGLEYDTVSGKYAEFVEAEVLPRVEMEAKVKLTTDPEGRATMGGSSGGAAAFSMGWFHPDLYHRVMTYSGTYVNQQSPTNPMTPHGAWEFHEHLIPAAPAKPLRIWMEVGDRDNGAGSSAAGLHNWVLANQGMSKVLAAKNYHYRFEFAKGAGHVDKNVVAATLPEAMLWLWRGYPIQ
jgi:enterochelin esterase family protein